MTVNPHLIPILDEWLETKNPGFAIMVTAPWGAGKSFAVKEWLASKQHVYVTLFGVDSARGIEEALFDAALARDSGNDTSKLAEATSRTFDHAAKLLGGAIQKATNVAVDLSGMYQKAVLSQLPKLIVFDDIERARMPADEILSVLNRFVEHESKSVLLIANEAEIGVDSPQIDDENPKLGSNSPTSGYRRWREKVVGRTVTLYPETSLALPKFLDDLPKGIGRELLLSHRALVEVVFNKSGIQNLRILRQSSCEMARFLNRLPAHYLEQKRALAGLIGDYLALSLAWSEGTQLKEEDFRFEAHSWRRAVSSINNEKLKEDRIQELKMRYENIADVTLDGMHLPGELALELIVRGFADDATIDHYMKQAFAFVQLSPEPWRILWYWPRQSEHEIERARAIVEGALSSRSIEHAEVILHLFSTFLDFAHHDVYDFKKEDVVNRAVSYISDVATNGSLSLAVKFDGWFGRDLRDSSLGYAYHQRETEEFKTISTFLIGALEKMKVATRPQRLETLMVELEEDPSYFVKAMNGGDGLRGIPDLSEETIFLGADPALIAQRVFSLEPGQWSLFLSQFKQRLERQLALAASHAVGQATERTWLEDFRSAAYDLAATASSLKRVQMKWALGELSFLDSLPPIPNKPLIPHP